MKKTLSIIALMLGSSSCFASSPIPSHGNTDVHIIASHGLLIMIGMIGGMFLYIAAFFAQKKNWSGVVVFTLLLTVVTFVFKDEDKQYLLSGAGIGILYIFLASLRSPRVRSKGL